MAEDEPVASQPCHRGNRGVAANKHGTVTHALPAKQLFHCCTVSQTRDVEI